MLLQALMGTPISPYADPTPPLNQEPSPLLDAINSTGGGPQDGMMMIPNSGGRTVRRSDIDQPTPLPPRR